MHQFFISPIIVDSESREGGGGGKFPFDLAQRFSKRNNIRIEKSKL